MLRTRTAVRPLSLADREDALALCARRVDHHVFVAARILEASRYGTLSGVFGHRGDGGLDAVCWASSNIVPVETTDASRAAFAERMRRWRGRCASVLGPAEEVRDLWGRLEPHFGAPRTLRSHQPVMTTTTPPSALGIELDPRVRPARPGEADLVLPAAYHMFTAEIGYPPYSSSPRTYKGSLASLIARGHTWIALEGNEVVFKADVGSLALGCAQLQGVWLAPHLRGRGLAAPLLASVVEQIMVAHAPMVTLYVNDFNVAARRLYERLGFVTTGEFTTVLL